MEEENIQPQYWNEISGAKSLGFRQNTVIGLLVDMRRGLVNFFRDG
jgi:hypothetical protein